MCATGTMDQDREGNKSIPWVVHKPWIDSRLLLQPLWEKKKSYMLL